ncbi:MAG: radical SAM protein [Vulcanisaeta sp.]|nr:radical SAM protein [Vulcanisaeta sp.]
MDLIRYIEFKEKLREKLESRLSPESLRRAREDGHARRRPRPCGMTIHTGVGCSFACVYCYIYDMGFTTKVKPYPLTGEELLYALVVNPYVLLGPGATMFAIGSVTEPFLPETRDKALEYIRVLGGLGNPIQVSSKATLPDEYISKIREYAPHISFLESITCLKNCRRLEPNAPDPIERLEFVGRLIKAGINAALFIRPIIPGITDRDIRDILELAREVGVKTVVLGTLRVTRNIYLRLRNVGIDLTGRLSTMRLGNEQVPIKARDLKEGIAKLAREMGFRVYEAACGANIEAAGLGCYACKWGPCGDVNKIPQVDPRDINEFLKYLGYSGSVEYVNARKVVIRLSKGDAARVTAMLRELLRRDVVIKGSRLGVCNPPTC